MSFIGYGSAPQGPDSTGSADDDTVWGWDDSELIKVGISPTEQLREITIDPSWKSTVPAHALSTAVMSAYLAAVMNRVATRNVDATSDSPSASEYDGSGIPTIDYELMEQVERERNDYIATYQEALTAEKTFVSADGNVTVTARGGSPGSISFDTAWMGFAEARHIAASTTEALRPAIESGLAIAEQMRDQFPAIAEFRRLREIKKAARGW